MTPHRRQAWKTPLAAAFFCSLLLSAGCRSPVTVAELPAAACEGETTSVAAVQGEGASSPLDGREVTVRGIATHVEPDAGWYLEEILPDDSDRTSNALYVHSPELAGRLREGDRLVASGEVAELGKGRDTLTSLTRLAGFRLCESGVPLPLTNTRLPLSAGERESLEAMHLSLQQSLYVTDVRHLGEGRIRISYNSVLPAPTEVARPGTDARAQAARNRAAALDIELAQSDRQQYSVGATVLAVQGVMGNRGRGAELIAKSELPFMPVPVYRVQGPGDGEIRIAGLNLHNYFNGDGAGGGFPGPRGAATAAEFARQRNRLIAAIGHIRPDLIGVSELENDGFAPGSAAQDFLRDLQSATGHPWAVVNPADRPVGNDLITVGIFYRSDRLQPSGRARVLIAPPFEGLSRRPIAQSFLVIASGETFTVVANHLKSKGSCPDSGPNADKLDGQGCWNPARLEAARMMSEWAGIIAGAEAGGRVLILGDMNAYRMEDPIQALITAGYRDLTGGAALRHEYSFVYRGETGTLDYAFASPQLARHVRSARILNINAGYAPGREPDHPWLRSSDHDPVVVDLRLRHADTRD